MTSFFSLSLSCLNAGSRIIYPMAQHLVFPQRLGRAHATNVTPHVAVTVYVPIMFLVPAVLEINTNPLTTFGGAGTLAAFGFLLAYFRITAAAPAYLAKRRELRPRHLVVAALAFLCLLVPTVSRLTVGSRTSRHDQMSLFRDRDGNQLGRPAGSAITVTPGVAVPRPRGSAGAPPGGRGHSCI